MFYVCEPFFFFLTSFLFGLFGLGFTEVRRFQRYFCGPFFYPTEVGNRKHPIFHQPYLVRVTTMFPP